MSRLKTSDESDNVVYYKSNVIYKLVHLYSSTCHLQVISHGTIAFIGGQASNLKHYVFNFLLHAPISLLKIGSSFFCAQI